jgi:hypothetical protein
MSYYGVNAGDGNSIFDIAYKFKQMELREMDKVPSTIRENKMSGSDTGSTDFLTKLQELHSMIFHIDKKSDFVVGTQPPDELLKKYEDSDKIKAYVQIFLTDGLNKYYELKDGNITITSGKNLKAKFESELDNADSLPNPEYEKYNIVKGLSMFLSPPNTLSARYTDSKASKEIHEKMGNIMQFLMLTAQTGATEVASQDTFEKLSKISDTIPNLLKTILKTVNDLVSHSTGKSEVWGSEYDDKSKRKLDETIKEIETEYNSLEIRPSVQQYIRIYKQIEEPLSILITNVKGMIDNTVTFRGPQQFSLQPLQVITQEKLDEIQQSLDIIDNVRYSNVVEIVKSFASKIYPYVDNENDIIDDALRKLKRDLEGEIITDDEWSRISNTQKKKDSKLLYKQFAGRDNLLRALAIVDQLLNEVEDRTLIPEDERLRREKEYNEEAKGRYKDQTGQFVGAGKRRDAKQYLDPEYYHFINTMPMKRFL